jgi:hypothetical protein
MWRFLWVMFLWSQYPDNVTLSCMMIDGWWIGKDMQGSVLSQRLPEAAEENHKMTSEYPVPRNRFRPKTPRNMNVERYHCAKQFGKKVSVSE